MKSEENSKMYLSSLMALLCCSFVNTQNSSASTEWPSGFDPERQCNFACKETVQSTNILCSSEHLQGSIYTPLDTQYCSMYGRIVCQVSELEFTSLAIDTANDCPQDILDLTGVMIQSDSDNSKPCQSVLNGTSTEGDCLEMNIFVSLGCEQTTATVIPVHGWTRDLNTEHFCIYIRSPQSRSQSDSVEPSIATSDAVSSTLPLPACTNAAIEPTASILSTLSTLVRTEPTPSLIFDASTSLTSPSNSESSTDCVCSNEETATEAILTVVTSKSMTKASSSHTPGPNIVIPDSLMITESDQDETTNDESDFKLAILIAVPVLGTVAIVATLGFFVLLIVIWLKKPCKSNSTSTVETNRGAY